jgi:hypothetical protein
VPELSLLPLVVLLDPPPLPLPLVGVYVVSDQNELKAQEPPLDQVWELPDVYVSVDHPFELADVVLLNAVV